MMLSHSCKKNNTSSMATCKQSDYAANYSLPAEASKLKFSELGLHARAHHNED